MTLITKTLTLSLLKYLLKNSETARNLSYLKPLYDIIIKTEKELKTKKPCNCSGNSRPASSDASRALQDQFNKTKKNITSLSDDDKSSLKKLLEVSRLRIEFYDSSGKPTVKII